MVLHNDQPTLLDSLDRGALVQEVGEAVANCEPPQVFGVHGDWGLGKTSLLHQIQWYLTGDCPQQSQAAISDAPQLPKGVYAREVRAVWFDAWRYQNEDAPVVALLQEIRNQLSWSQKARRTASRNTEILLRGALLSMEDLTKKIGFQYSKFRQSNREWEAANLSTPLPSYTLRDLLRQAIDQLLRNKNGKPNRLAIFIDDLDRCEPESAYRLLEGLKVYLTIENCVFVLGMNQKAIEEAIGSRMAAVPRRSRPQRAAAYMEKLCQNVWRLPSVRNPGDVLDRLLQTTSAKVDERQLIKRAVEVDGRQCLPPNPRRLKGLANLVARLSRRLPPMEGMGDEVAVREARLLVIVAYVYQFHQELYIRWEADSRLYWKILEWCNGSEDPEISVFDLLVLPQQEIVSDPDERAPTAPSEMELEFESTHPDPTEATVFWIQPLIRELGSGIDPDRFERYLHNVPT